MLNIAMLHLLMWLSNAQLEYLLEIGVTFAPKTETGR